MAGEHDRGSVCRVVINLIVVVIVVLGGNGAEGCFGAVDAFAPKAEFPVCQGAGFLVVGFGIFDDDGPISDAGFAPVRDRHEGPVSVAADVFVVAAWG